MNANPMLPVCLRDARPRRSRACRLAILLAILAILATTTPLYAAPPEPAAGAFGTGWILDRLAQPAPSRTGFVEVRGSALLREPLRISGEYQRPRDGILVREVRVPYAETTTISQDRVTIARAGRSPRSFALSRAPELVGLQASFGALLAGDRARLEQHYRIASVGTRERWMLQLTPIDAQLAAKVRGITLYGRGAELRCIETLAAGNGEVQRTLLADAAVAANSLDAGALTALCHDTAAR